MSARERVTPPLIGHFALVSEALDGASEQFGDAEAYVDGPARMSFREWRVASTAVAGLLRSRGVDRGDVVAIMLPASIEYAVVYAACARLGAVASGINGRLGRSEVAAIVDRCRPKLAVGESSTDVSIDAPTVSRHEIWSVTRHAIAGGRFLLDGEVGARRTDPVAIIWTSATTGLPKGAWFDHAGLEAAVGTAGVMAAPYDRRLVNTPFAHAGYMAKLWEQLAWGISIVIGPMPWTASDTVELISRERITVVGAVPTQWAKIVEDPLLDALAVTTLRLGVAATAPTPPELVARVTERLGCTLVVRYAMTESPSISGTEPGDPAEVLHRTVGRPQLGVEVEIRDDDGRPAKAADVGLIYVRSSVAMRGYWNDPEQTAAIMTEDGWLCSGDLGRFDPDGNLVLVGRSGDMYIRGGYNVYPLEVERVLSEHPGVAQVAVVGVPAPVIGEIGVACVVPTEALSAPTLEDLRQWCGRRIADYKAPDELVLLDDLPLTSMLKVDKGLLRRRVQFRPG